MINYIKNLWERFFPKAKALSLEKIDYVVNDPSTPELIIKNYEVPEPPNTPVFAVSGLSLPAMKAQSLNVKATLSRSLNYVQSIVSKFRAPIGRWAGTNPLAIITRAGKDWNAFYNRNSLSFFYNNDPETGRTIFTCDSADVVSHELGHAILDALRPDFWSVQNIEAWAFHEAFSDIVAVLTIMQYNEVLNKAIKDTNGDLSKSNIITRLAEEMGTILHKITKGNSGYVGYLRDLTLRFDYINPNLLPNNAPHDKLSKESHSFGRVFSGAWYAMFVRIYKKEYNNGKSALESAIIARDACANYLFVATTKVPKTASIFTSLVKEILHADMKAGSPYSKEISDAFRERKMEFKITMLSEENDEEYANKITSLKLSDYLILGQSDNPLYNIEVEIAGDKDEEDAIDAALTAVKYIDTNNDLNKKWIISNGKLVRKHFN